MDREGKLRLRICRAVAVEPGGKCLAVKRSYDVAMTAGGET